jgi:hypothetical protein
VNKLKTLRFIALGLGLAYLLPIACGSGGVVGGECKKTNGVCEPGNGNGGASGASNGKGGGPTTNTSGNGNSEAGNGTAAAPQGGEGELPDGGFFDSPVDGQSDAEAPLECLPPHDSPSHCGACDTKCVAPNPFCAPDSDGGFVCVPQCGDPLVECQGQCVDPISYKTDPDNCGKCGNECPSDICQDSKCVGAKYGNIALICTDFNSVTPSSSPTTLLGNAVFMPQKNPVEVLAYTRGASVAAVNRLNQVITWAGDARGRSAHLVEAKAVADVSSKLNVNDFQVLLIHDLDQAKTGDAAAAATTWESANVLSSFAKAGGVIVVIDGSDGRGEMHELINAGNLLDPTAKTSISGQTEIMNEQVWNNAPFDVLGVNVLSPFLGTSHTCTFDTDAKPGGDTIFVLSDDEAGGLPVAIHRVIAP